jgi:hypothetical protein
LLPFSQLQQKQQPLALSYPAELSAMMKIFFIFIVQHYIMLSSHIWLCSMWNVAVRNRTRSSKIKLWHFKLLHLQKLFCCVLLLLVSITKDGRDRRGIIDKVSTTVHRENSTH